VGLDVTFSLFWLSLAISAAAVVLFVWLMRDEKPGGVRREAGGEAEPSKADPPEPEA
jgi:hypothetical protein